MEILPNRLFGPYIIELHRFFSQRFQHIYYQEGMDTKQLQVFYGQPRAAFRYLTEKFNGKIVLPMLNFWAVNPTRNLQREKPGVVITDIDSYDPTSKTIARMRVPMHFNVTWSCNLWADNMKDADYIMHELFQSMPGGELTLIFFTDFEMVNDQMIIKDRTQYILMPLKLEESFSNDTEVEQLEMQQVRERIKIGFNLLGQTIVPYNVMRVPVFEGLSVVTKIIGQPTSKEIYEQGDFQ